MIPGMFAAGAVRDGPSPWTTVVIDLGFNGSDGGTSFPDASGRSWTRFGNAQTSTAEFVEGNASLLLDGSGDYLTTPSTTDLQAQGDFRIECWVRPANVSRLMNIASKRVPGAAQSGFSFYLDNGEPGVIAWGGSTPVIQLQSPDPLVVNQWRKVAFEKIGPQWSLIIGGVTVASDTQTSAPANNNQPLYIGRDQIVTGRDFDGFIDYFRFLRP